MKLPTNLNFRMTFLERIGGDLRDKKLWPLAVVLVAAVIAVPVLLSKGGSSTPVVAQAPAPSQAAPRTGIPVVSTGSNPSPGKLNGTARDPFTQIAHGTTTGPASAINAAGTATTVPGTGTSTTSTTSGTGSSSSNPSTGAIPAGPTTTIPTGTPKPAPPGLKADQSYEVKLAITNSLGGVDTINPLERLSVLPSPQLPLLVELGVLKGGSRVLFAVQPGVVVSGAGSCIPAPIDCEILSLHQGQIEALGMRSSSGVEPVALFAVTGITAADHPSVADANKARQESSAAGRAVLSASPSAALSLFQYQASIGALVDLRNLTVEG